MSSISADEDFLPNWSIADVINRASPEMNASFKAALKADERQTASSALPDARAAGTKTAIRTARTAEIKSKMFRAFMIVCANFSFRLFKAALKLIMAVLYHNFALLIKLAAAFLNDFELILEK